MEEEDNEVGAGAGQRRGLPGGGEPEAKRRCVDASEGRPIDVVVKVRGVPWLLTPAPALLTSAPALLTSACACPQLNSVIFYSFDSAN